MSQSCRYREDTAQSNQIARKTLAKLERLALPTNPIHFSLLYEQATQIDTEIAQQVEQLLAQDNYNLNTARPLFIALLTRILQNQTPTEEISQLIQHLLQHLDNWHQDARAQQSVLDKNLQCLQQCKTPQEINNCLQNTILPPINHIQQHTEQLYSQLQSAAEVIRQLKQQLEQATSLSKTDSLTNIANRRGYDERLLQFIQHAQQKSQTFAMLLLDLDHFKQVNDRFGHLVGDSALRYIARVLTQQIREKDALARLGGEEFVILLADVHYDQAMKVAELIRKQIQAKSLRVKGQEQSLSFTISIGLAIYQMGEDGDSLFDRADKALYQAKQTGRNRVCAEPLN
jgi:diguanylate cyclase